MVCVVVVTLVGPALESVTVAVVCCVVEDVVWCIAEVVTDVLPVVVTVAVVWVVPWFGKSSQMFSG